MISVTERAYAKLNLCLTVGGRLENGYHLIESVMQSISLCDTVGITKSNTLSLGCGNRGLPTDSGNLAHRAATLFFAESGIKGGAHIDIEKRIPVCAGLGGGSANAAAVLRGLNKLYGTPFDTAALCRLGAALGADVPFCITGGTAFATGVGEKLLPLPHTPLYYVLMFDQTPLSTPQMYAALDAGVKAPANAAACRDAVLGGNSVGAAQCAANSFYAVALEKCPQIGVNRGKLMQNGAIAATVTGKGPTVFGVFCDQNAAQRCANAINGAFFCQSVPAFE